MDALFSGYKRKTPPDVNSIPIGRPTPPYYRTDQGEWQPISSLTAQYPAVGEIYMSHSSDGAMDVMPSSDPQAVHCAEAPQHETFDTNGATYCSHADYAGFAPAWQASPTSAGPQSKHAVVGSGSWDPSPTLSAADVDIGLGVVMAEFGASQGPSNNEVAAALEDMLSSLLTSDD
jgi:hypothetical protein